MPLKQHLDTAGTFWDWITEFDTGPAASVPSRSRLRSFGCRPQNLFGFCLELPDRFNSNVLCLDSSKITLSIKIVIILSTRVYVLIYDFIKHEWEYEQANFA
jgi:hypothetical protein